MPPSKDPIRLNLGCGLQAPSGWINVDGSWNARLAKYPLLRRALFWFRLLPADKVEIPWSPSIVTHDVRKRLPFSDGSVAAVYASHVLEHLYREEGQRLVAEAFCELWYQTCERLLKNISVTANPKDRNPAQNLYGPPIK